MLERRNEMQKMAIVSGVICILLAALIFIFADGLRRYYSGGFFLLIGIVMLLQAFRRQNSNKK